MTDFKTQNITTKFLIVVVLLSQLNSLSGQKRTYQAEKINGKPPIIDGVISDTVWNIAEWTGNFTQTKPFENVPPSQQTEFKIIYDDNNLYVAIKAYDTALDSIERRMSRRDNFAGDWVEINIDSYHDLLTAHSFTVNAAGVKGDEIITNDDNWDSSWDPIWYVKTSTDNEGWTAEMKIPLTQLRFSQQKEYKWGLQVTRRLFRKKERSSWQFISPQTSGWVSHFGEMQGIKEIKPKKQKDITPYIVTGFESYKKEQKNPYSKGLEYVINGGVDGKFGITNNLTLDFTINPDFGQVEADPSEVNLSNFETYLTEKRIFFIEGKNILSHRIVGGDGSLSRDNIFYSRRIGKKPSLQTDLNDEEYAENLDKTAILGAFKLTGKTKKGWSVGILESVTKKENINIYNEQNGERKEIAEPFTNYFVSRIEKDLNNSNTRFGAIVTATNRDLTALEVKNTMHKEAFTGGVNFNHNWKKKTYYISLNLVGSHISGSSKAIYETQTSSPHYFQRPDAGYLNADSTRTELQGYGGTIQIGKQGNGKLRYTNWITWRSPELNLNDIGYMYTNDEIQQVFWVGYRQNEPFLIFREANININQWYGLTFGLDRRYFGGNINGHVQYKNHWCTGLGIARDGKSLSTHALRGGPSLVYDGYTNFWGHIGTDERKKIRAEVSYSGGIRDHQSSSYKNIGLSINIQATDALSISIRPSCLQNKDKYAFVKTFENDGADRYIMGYLKKEEASVVIRFTYNINPDFTIQYYGMPFISAGRYSDFKYVINPKSNNINERFRLYTEDEISFNQENDEYEIDDNIDGTTDYSFDNKNFNIKDFNSNLVLRWEYEPGSSLYLVWSQRRFDNVTNGKSNFGNDFANLFIDTHPHDVVLVKFSYRFGL